MNRQEIIVPRDEAHWRELRSHDVTSTEVPALFDCSPYLTKFELFHRLKSQAIVEVAQNERMKWGTYLQDAIAGGIAKEHNLPIRRMTEYIRDPDARMGASFDFAVGDYGILEIKNVDFLAFRDGWIQREDGTIEAPPHIELQLQEQLAVSGRSVGYIGALVAGNDLHLLERERNQKVIDAIYIQVGILWRDIEQDKPPTPDYIRDAEFLSKLYRNTDPNSVLDVRDDKELRRLVSEYKLQSNLASQADKTRKAIKAMILERIGPAEKAFGENFTISAGLIKGGFVEAYEKQDYRGFRITHAKEK